MQRYRLLSFLSLLGVMFAAAPAHAAGYWNLPSTFCQCMGYGNGAGYHVPLVLGPVSHHGWLAHNHVRLPYAPHPPYAWYGHGRAGPAFHEPSVLEPANFRPAEPYFEPLPGAVHGGPLRR